MIRPLAPGGRWGQSKFRPPSDPEKIRPERRKPVPVDAIGRPEAKLTYDQLTEAQRRRFDAQLAAWRAACSLATIYANSAKYGMPVPPDPINVWLHARRTWKRNR